MEVIIAGNTRLLVEDVPLDNKISVRGFYAAKTYMNTWIVFPGNGIHNPYYGQLCPLYAMKRIIMILK